MMCIQKTFSGDNSSFTSHLILWCRGNWMCCSFSIILLCVSEKFSSDIARITRETEFTQAGHAERVKGSLLSSLLGTLLIDFWCGKYGYNPPQWPFCWGKNPDWGTATSSGQCVHRNTSSEELKGLSGPSIVENSRKCKSPRAWRRKGVLRVQVCSAQWLTKQIVRLRDEIARLSIQESDRETDRKHFELIYWLTVMS